MKIKLVEQNSLSVLLLSKGYLFIIDILHLFSIHLICMYGPNYYASLRLIPSLVNFLKELRLH